MELLRDLLFDYTLRTVTLGAAALGVVSGTLGVFAVLRRQALLGDVVSHAALPGIVLAFMLTGSKATLVLVLGAFIAGWIGMLLAAAVVRTTRVPGDSAFGIVLSVFFGFGLVLLTLVQRMPTAAQAGLDRFLFGQAATLVHQDVLVLGALGLLALIAVVAFWKEFKVLSFDPEFGASLGLPMRAVDVLLTTVLVLAIVTGLQTVGVVLMAALIVAPAAAARQWTDSLALMTVLAAGFGALAGASGAVTSSLVARMPTGPTIVLAAGAIVLVSLYLAPHRGLAWQRLRLRRQRREIRTDTVLADLYALYRRHGTLDHGHATAVLEVMTRVPGGTLASLEELRERGLAHQLADGGWTLTADGLTAAEERLRALGRVNE